jgi:Short C-terminal domain
MAGKHRAGAQAGEDAREEPVSEVPPDVQPVEAAPPPAPPEPAAPTAGPSHDAIERLTQLGALHEQGVLTDEEFARQKTLLLG